VSRIMWIRSTKTTMARNGMRNLLLLGAALVSMSLLSCVELIEAARAEFQVVTETQAATEGHITPSSFSLVPSLIALDAATKTRLFTLVSRELETKGWQAEQDGSGEFLVSVAFGMGSSGSQRSRSVGTYSSTTKEHDQTRITYTKDTYHYVINLSFAHRSTPESVAWSAECTSSGSTRDIMAPARLMIPYAIAKLGQEGKWREKVRPW
jgi:hypothetical protein